MRRRLARKGLEEDEFAVRTAVPVPSAQPAPTVAGGAAPRPPKKRRKRR
jgi:hypothetical protein